MKPKKNPKADLNRRWVLFLQIGLIIVLFLTLQAIEWETSVAKPADTSGLTPKIIMEETPPATITPETTPPPPPPKMLIDKIEPIEDDEPDKEDATLSTDLEFDEIPEVIDIVDPDDPEDIIYNVLGVEEVPLFPGCDALASNEKRKACLNDKVNSFVTKNFNTAIGEDLNLTGTNLVLVMFTVDTQGKITDIKTRAPHPRLEEEARRVINKLPKMEPGRQGGKAVPVQYSIPIRFRVQD